MTPRDELRDAWLAQALRHAPDADADAPPALSDTILREARAAVPPTPASSASSRPGTIGPLQWVASAWDWLARPPVAAGFASVMVATLAGILWWGQPLDQTLPRPPEVVSPTPQARTEAAPPESVAAAPAAPKTGDDTLAAAAQGRLAETKEAEKSARTPRPIDERTRMRSTAAAPATVPAPAAFPATPPAPAVQPAPAANEAQPPPAQRRELAAPTSKAMADSPAEAAADKAAPLRNDSRALQGSASPSVAKARAADTTMASLATLRAQIAQQPERWHWQRGQGAPQPMNAAVQGWLAELDLQTASRWQASAESAARATAGSVRLLRDGKIQATLGFAGSAVWAETPGASVAPMPEGAAESLRKALDDATL